MLHGCAKHHAPDAPEAVDADFDSHAVLQKNYLKQIVTISI
jgi:hypothetical protein